jgi:hypothetical protein
MNISFLFPAVLILGLQVWKRRRAQRGNVLRLIQDRVSDAELCKNPANLSKQFAGKGASPIRVQEKRSAFHRRAQ